MRRRPAAGRPPPLWAAAAAVVALALGGAHGATTPGACVAVPGGGELTVAGVGRALFAALATDRARDAARLSGGVCVELSAIGGVLRSERIELSDLSGDVILEADDVTVSLPGWTLRAAGLRADAAGAELVGVVLEGAEAVARARSAVVDLASGAVDAVGVRLLTESLWIDAARARVDGSAVEVEDAWLTTCDCPPAEADARIEARSARIDLTAASAVLAGAEFVVGRWRGPLPDPWSLSADALADLRPPFTWGADPEGRRGTIVTFAEQPLGPGARWTWQAATGTERRDPDVGVRLDAAAGGVSLAFVGASDRLSVRWRVARPVVGGWTVAVAQRLEGGGFRESVRDNRVELGWAGRRDPAVGRLELAALAFAAASAQSREAGEVVGARLGVEGAVRWSAVSGPWRVGVDVTGGATAYPAVLGFGSTPQAHVSVSPSLAVTGSAWRVSATHLARWVAGASPFGVDLDRAERAQRSDLRVDVGSDGTDWRGHLAVRWDWRADWSRPGQVVGLERFDVGVDGGAPVGSGRLAVRFAAALAGVIDPRAERRATWSTRAAWTVDGWEIGGRILGDLAPASDPWRSVTVFVAVPIETGDWTWRPYLEIDVAAIARSAPPVVVGHGLELTWRSCCATIDLGYRHDPEGGTSLRAGLRVEPHDLDPTRLALRPAGLARSAAARDPR